MALMFAGGGPLAPEPEATRTESLRLGIGRMCTHVVDTLGRPDGKLHLISGHDWSVSPLLMALTRPDDDAKHLWPPFCSNLALELWSCRDDDWRGAAPRGAHDGSGAERSVGFWAAAGREHARDEGRYVRAVYNGVAVDMPCSSEGGGRDGACSLADFRSMLAKFCVDDFAAECSTTRSSKGDQKAGQQAAPRFNR